MGGGGGTSGTRIEDYPLQRRATEPLLPPVKEQGKDQEEEVPPTIDEGSK